MRVLSRAQRQHFDSEGFVVVEDVLDPDQEIAGVLAEYADALGEIANDFHHKGLIPTPYGELPFTERLIRVSQESGQPIPQFFDFSLPQTGVRHDTPIRVGPAVFRLLTSPRLLDLVEDLVGAEIYSNPVQHIRMKLPKRAIPEGFSNGLVTQIPWHQDNGVILQEADDATILTVWLPLLDATFDNGCLQVIPSSHRAGLATHCPGNSVHIPDELVPNERALPLPMRPGSVLLMTQRTIHSSLDNLTDDQVRISMDLRYQPIGQPTGRPAFAPAGFVARSRAHPDRVLNDPAVWAERWLILRNELAEQENPTFNRWTNAPAVCA
ncbi:MAG TPA: phytanoyl-CoA dioxygenase family protein [Chloroflexota bacterium]